MFENFSDRARQVMRLADLEAQRCGHEYIGTEHILLGLVKEGSGTAVNVLKNLGVDIQKVQSETEKLAHCCPELLGTRPFPHTPRAKRVVEFAREEARNLGVWRICTEHLLLGLMREEEGVASLVLCGVCGLTVERVREELRSILGIEQKPGEAEGMADVHLGSPEVQPSSLFSKVPSRRAVRVCESFDALWSALAGEVGCSEELMPALGEVLRKALYFDRLKPIVALAYEELQNRTDPDKLLGGVLHRARVSAEALRHGQVEPVHVFGGLMGMASERVCDTLRSLCLSRDQWSAALQQRFLGKKLQEGACPLSQLVENWLLSQIKRIALSRETVLDVSSLMLDLIDAPDGQVRQFLGDGNVDVNRVRAVLQEASG